jgi:hypothetical protein
MEVKRCYLPGHNKMLLAIDSDDDEAANLTVNSLPIFAWNNGGVYCVPAVLCSVSPQGFPCGFGPQHSEYASLLEKFVFL